MKSRSCFLTLHYNYLLSLLPTYTFKSFLLDSHLEIDSYSLFLHALAYKGNKHHVQHHQEYNELSWKRLNLASLGCFLAFNERFHNATIGGELF